MSKIIFPLLLLILPFLECAQHKFTIELEAPSYISKSILLSPTMIRKGFESFYHFELDTNNQVINFGKKLGIGSAFFQIKVQEKNVISGQFEYPQPVSFQYYEPKEKRVFISDAFFLDSGSFKIELPENFNSYQVRLNSPINTEYVGFKKIFSDLYSKVPGKIFDSLSDLSEKEKRIGTYIRKHPASYIALWEIIDDYTHHNYNPAYLENLQLFSDEIRKTELFKKFENKLKSEQLTANANFYSPNHSLQISAFLIHLKNSAAKKSKVTS